MKQPSSEDLLGYMLGALDARDARRVEESLERDPGLEQDLCEMKATLAPLEMLDERGGPPPALARRTCQVVAAASRHGDEAILAGDSGAIRMSAPADGGMPELGRASWSLVDLLVACTAAAIVGAVLLPAISLSRFNSRVIACQSNLQCLFHSMVSWAEMNDGEFVRIPDSGPLSVAGCFGPYLKESGLLESDQLLSCPGISGSAEPARIPTLTEVANATTVPQTLDMQRRMGGHYGYSLGNADNGIYRAPRSMGRANFALLADSPTFSNGNSRSSRNHGPSGQNILFEGGRVSFVTSPIIGTDEVFLNDLMMVAPGIHNLDSVVAPSHVHPIKLVWQ